MRKDYIPLRKQILERPALLASLAFLGFVVLCAILLPFFLPPEYRAVTQYQLLPPSLKHPFGTDLNGRDVFYRVLDGARISLSVGMAGAFISLVIGTTYGLVAGYAGGKIDSFMMRIVDTLNSIPRLLFILVFINAYDGELQLWLQKMELPGLVGYSKIIIMILSLGLIEWLTMARIVRGQVLVIKSLPFVAAARALGQSHLKILFKHLLPNLSGIIIVYVTLTIPAVILDETFLSFLGLGIQAPQASWGTLLSDGAQVINPVKSYWWLLAFPAIVMSSTLLALNILGDGLRDILDPRKAK